MPLSEPRASSRGSKQALRADDVADFPDDSMFHAFARQVCLAGGLPRKELFETWEFAKRARRRLTDGPIVDLACGHGLAAWALLVMDGKDRGPALCIDTRIPESAARLHAALSERWPAAGARITTVEADLATVALPRGARILAVHACGALTDLAIDRALETRSSIAALPCCQSHGKQDPGGLTGWLDPDLAIDATRVARLRHAHYRVWTTTLPSDITPKNRLFVGAPA